MMYGSLNLKIKDAVALSALSLMLIALIAEFVFAQKGCFFCWVQRWVLLTFALSVYLSQRRIFRMIAWLLLLSGFALGLLQTHFLMSSIVSDVCIAWGIGLPRVIFQWLLTFPTCDHSGPLMIPWVVWLLFYYSAIMGLMFRRKVDEHLF